MPAPKPSKVPHSETVVKEAHDAPMFRRNVTTNTPDMHENAPHPPTLHVVTPDISFHVPSPSNMASAAPPSPFEEEMLSSISTLEQSFVSGPSLPLLGSLSASLSLEPQSLYRQPTGADPHGVGSPVRGVEIAVSTAAISVSHPVSGTPAPAQLNPATFARQRTQTNPHSHELPPRALPVAMGPPPSMPPMGFPSLRRQDTQQDPHSGAAKPETETEVSLTHAPDSDELPPMGPPMGPPQMGAPPSGFPSLFRQDTEADPHAATLPGPSPTEPAHALPFDPTSDELPPLAPVPGMGMAMTPSLRRQDTQQDPHASGPSASQSTSFPQSSMPSMVDLDGPPPMSGPSLFRQNTEQDPHNSDRINTSAASLSPSLSPSPSPSPSEASLAVCISVDPAAMETTSEFLVERQITVRNAHTANAMPAQPPVAIIATYEEEEEIALAMTKKLSVQKFEEWDSGFLGGRQITGRDPHTGKADTEFEAPNEISIPVDS